MPAARCAVVGCGSDDTKDSDSKKDKGSAAASDDADLVAAANGGEIEG